ncbi:MAG: MotA/TolQ/ExbB proton channel family protein [Deltaproteobacteria bacterium]|nr:MotA/TolQ/ExbB proton channel family protein [Deltaproteobacteria bacterium]
MHTSSTEGLIHTMLSLPLFKAEWVLLLLILLSLVSVAIMVERYVFYKRHSIKIDEVKDSFSKFLNDGDFEGAAKYLAGFDSLETNVVLFGLKSHQLGPESVEDLLGGGAQMEQARYDKWLSFLATIAANAPFIGLFGTVIGIIRAFNDLAGNMSEASSSVMAGISEALSTTAVGLLVAIPAVVAFNIYKSKVKGHTENLGLLASILTSSLKSVPASEKGKD